MLFFNESIPCQQCLDKIRAGEPIMASKMLEQGIMVQVILLPPMYSEMCKCIMNPRMYLFQGTPVWLGEEVDEDGSAPPGYKKCTELECKYLINQALTWCDKCVENHYQILSR